MVYGCTSPIMDDARRTSKKHKKNEARKDLFVGAVEDLKAIS
jgi:hypothetical protein